MHVNKHSLEVPANDVANVINCFVDYFPCTGEPFNFTLYHPERPLQTISKALWVAKCLEQTGCKKISAYFRRNLLGAIETKNVYYGFEDGDFLCDMPKVPVYCPVM